MTPEMAPGNSAAAVVEARRAAICSLPSPHRTNSSSPNTEWIPSTTAVVEARRLDKGRRSEGRASYSPDAREKRMRKARRNRRKGAVPTSKGEEDHVACAAVLAEK